jgi:hypothetical protein
MDDRVIESRRSGPAYRAPLTGSMNGLGVRRRLGGEGTRGARVMGWLALGSLVAAIFLSVVIAIARGETTPLYVTWISALVMAAVSGVLAATLVVSGRRAARTVVVEPPAEDIDVV